jgi:PKD domain
MRRNLLITVMVCASWLTSVGAAQAIVVDMNALGPPSVAYSAANRDDYTGVAMVPGTRSDLTSAGIPAVSTGAPCLDPALPSDLILKDTGICSHGGAVMHANETFAFTWDPTRRYWSTTRDFMESFLSDVAKGSGTLSSPYADMSQYSDSSGHAANLSAFGGGCIDFGHVGGSACRFGTNNASGAGHDYAASDCPVTGTNLFNMAASGAPDPVPNDLCLSDAQLRGEVATMISTTGVPGRTKAGYTPLIVLLTPPGVVTCLDGAGTLCSANSMASARFCSYHGEVNLGGTAYAYVVQPWTADTACDEPDIPPLSVPAPVEQIARDAGVRMVSALSQAQMAAITNPGLNGWFGLGGNEINDNGCVPFGIKFDTNTVGTGSYYLQREFNNAGAIESDPNALPCTGWVTLSPTFVVPSAVQRGDVVQFDGSTTPSSLMVPKNNYIWSFGDGTSAIGPSVVHTYSAAGVFPVKLTVADRGANLASVSQNITVLGAGGTTPPPPGGKTKSAMKVRLQLMPQGLHSLLRDGVALRVTSNEAADGVSTLMISRGAAKRAHLHTGRGPTVVVGRGTVSGVKAGTVRLRLHLSRSVAAKLGRLSHVKLEISLRLVAAGGDHVTQDVAGSY